MKKIALVLAVLLVVGGTAFAEVTVGGEATVSGTVETTIGMDLQSGNWGADNNDSFKLMIPLAAGSAGASGDDEAYGEINLSGIALNLKKDALDDDDNSAGTLSGKIVFGDLYVGLNWGGYQNNYAAGTEDYDVNLKSSWFDVPGYGDIAVGFNNGMIGVELEVAAKQGITRAGGSDQDKAKYTSAWTGDLEEKHATATTQDGENGVILSADLEYISDMITFPVYITLDPAYATDTVLFGASVDPSVTAGMVTVTCPVDFVMIGEEMGVDLAPTLSLAVMEGITISADSYIYYHVDNYGYGDVGVKFATDGLVSGLTASVDVDLTNVNHDLGWGFDVAVGYALMDGLTVNVKPGYDSTNDVDVAASLVCGSAFTGIDNTTITLDYAKGVANTTGDVNLNDAGILSLITKVAF